jgi:hypothetical protein
VKTAFDLASLSQDLRPSGRDFILSTVFFAIIHDPAFLDDGMLLQPTGALNR